MKPKIGIKTKNIMKTIEKGLESDVVELISFDPRITFGSKRISKIKELLKGKDLSMHSQTTMIFSAVSKYDVPDFAEGELYALRAEIILCKTLGAKELIFHLKDGKLSDSEIKSLRDILDFAKENGVEMIYESNFTSVAENDLGVLAEFSDLKYNFDIGHLNIAVTQNTLGMSAEDFISRIKDRIVYVHAHNNDGIIDQHRGLKYGNLDWKKIFDLLDFTNIRKVMAEVEDHKETLETKKMLEEYFDE